MPDDIYNQAYIPCEKYLLAAGKMDCVAYVLLEFADLMDDTQLKVFL